MKDVLVALQAVKGVGPATIKKLTQAREEKCGGHGNGKEGDEGGMDKGSAE